MKPMIVAMHIETLWSDVLEGYLPEVKKRIEELIEKHGPMARLNYEEGYDGEWRYHLYVDRPETPKEMEKRIIAQQAAQARMAEHERHLYEQLKAKFEGVKP